MAAEAGVVRPSAIELQVDDLPSLFHMLDPAPYREKALDPDVEAFVVDWARELRSDRPSEILVHARRHTADQPTERQLEASVQAFFISRAREIGKQRQELLRTGRTSLAIGLVILALCGGAARLIANLVPGEIARTAADGLVILGWVANWRPIEIFLYDWWPLVRRQRLYARLARSRVRIARSETPGAG